jgi:outer membrane receptor protein involved in Fe transport
LPWFIVNNYPAFGTANTAGGADPYYRIDSQYQEVVKMSWIKGAHEVRFGTEIQQQYIDNMQPGAGAHGRLTFAGGPTQVIGGPSANQFNTYATFLLDLVTTAATSVVFNNNPPQEPINWHLYNLYVRDRWTLSHKLTVSYGARWDYFGFPNACTRGIGLYDIAANNVQIC